jgi:putative addiction module killer protein
MYQIETTQTYDHWLASLDPRVRIRLVARLVKLGRGLWGDCKSVGGSVTELREHFGAGYRIYVTQVEQVLVVALGGGDKSSQSKDIAEAIELAKQAHEPTKE